MSKVAKLKSVKASIRSVVSAGGAVTWKTNPCGFAQRERAMGDLLDIGTEAHVELGPANSDAGSFRYLTGRE